MNTAELALTISIFSVLVAALSLGWNIYRDVILKARVEIGFGVRTLMRPNQEQHPQYVMISATNHGPGVVSLSSIFMKDTSFLKWLLRRKQLAFIMHDYENPLSAQLPKKLDVADKADFLFPYDKDCLLQGQWSHIGLVDSFGRLHWARKKDVKEANEKWKVDFPASV